MVKLLLLSLFVSLVVLWAVSCGGGGGGYTQPTPTSPSPQPQNPPSANATINIVSSSGSGAFNPNPAQVPAGGTILWMNSTGVSHVLVMNDGASIGTLAPGASMTTTLRGSGGNYHCTTHPSMVGSLNGSTPAPSPAPGDGY
jgi:plastocyanin